MWDWTLVALWCGRTGGRAVYGHVITKFSGMDRFTYPWCSAGALRAPELCLNTWKLTFIRGCLILVNVCYYFTWKIVNHLSTLPICNWIGLCARLPLTILGSSWFRQSRRHPEYKLIDLDYADDIATLISSVGDAQKFLGRLVCCCRCWPPRQCHKNPKSRFSFIYGHLHCELTTSTWTP